MGRYADNVTDEYGAPVQGVSVYVYTQTNALAALTSDAAIPLANPVVTDDDGGFYFNTSDGIYALEFWSGGKKRFTDRQIMVGAGLPLPASVLVPLAAPSGAAIIGESGGDGNVQAALNNRAKTTTFALPTGSALSGFQQSGTGPSATAQSVQDKLRQTISVLDRPFGAKGDFTTDASPAIQAALVVAAATTGALYIPGGTYKCATPITIPSNVRIYGDGEATVLKKASETVGRLFQNSDQTNGNVNISIDNLVIDGNRTSSVYVPLKDGLYFTKCVNTRMRGVTIRNCLNDGFIDEYGVGTIMTDCVAENNAKDGFYWSGSDRPTVNACIARNNLVGGFAIAATWTLSGSGNAAYGNLGFNVSAGRDSRYCDFSCTVDTPPSAYALFTAAESIGASTIHGVTYPGNDILWSTTQCTFRMTGRGKVHAFLANDCTYDLNMDASNSQGFVLYGSKRNRIKGTIRNWTTGFPGLQFINATSGDGIPASMSPPISSDDNIYNELRIYDATGALVPLADAGSNNVGFGTQMFGSITDRFYQTGTWTPTLAGQTTAGAQTYGTREGSYVRIGKLVFVQGSIILTAKDAATAGNMRITGLPFAASATKSGSVAISEFYADLGGGLTNAGGNISAGGNIINLTQSGDNVTFANLDAINILATSRFRFAATYMVD